MFGMVRKVVAHFDRHGVSFSDLNDHTDIIDSLSDVVSPSNRKRTIALLHGLWEEREAIGVALLNPASLARLVERDIQHETLQTAYIPPRIWAYQIERLRECLDDFARHQRQVEDCFNFCVDAYAYNYGSLENLYLRDGKKTNHAILPFHSPDLKNPGVRSGRRFHGPFEGIMRQFGIFELMARWVSMPDSGWSVRQISTYLSLIQFAGLAYIINFTLMRISEARSLRSDCLYWELDERLGRIPIIRGETTKTDTDSDARWPTSPSVEIAVNAAVCVSRLRMRCSIADHRVNPSNADRANPRLVDYASDPWSGRPTASANPYEVSPRSQRYQLVRHRWPLLFEDEKLRITPEDFNIATMLTPNLVKQPEFAVGQIWPLSWHQLRRTSAVNMFASGFLSNSSMQVVLKHSAWLMPLYYGRGFTKLHLNEEVRATVVGAMYEAMAHGLQSISSDRYVSPHGESRRAAMLVNLVGDRDAKTLAQAGRAGTTTFREIRLGACTKLGDCEYGGIESVARCGGGDRPGACSDVLFDRAKAAGVKSQLKAAIQMRDQVQERSPRQLALDAEIRAMENYLDVTDR
jgi:hypothetical protein